MERLPRLIGATVPGLSLRGIDVLVRPATKIPVEPFDGKHLPLPDASVDAVMFIDVLHHTADPMVLLREANCVARRLILIKDHTMDGPLADPQRCASWIGSVTPNTGWRCRIIIGQNGGGARRSRHSGWPSRTGIHGGTLSIPRQSRLRTRPTLHRGAGAEPLRIPSLVVLFDCEQAGKKTGKHQLHANADCRYGNGNETQELGIIEIAKAHFAPGDNGAD